MLGFIIVCLIIGGITLLCPEFLVDTYRGSSRRKVDENTYLRAKKVSIIFLAIVMTIVVVYTVRAVKEVKLLCRR